MQHPQLVSHPPPIWIMCRAVVAPNILFCVRMGSMNVLKGIGNCLVSDYQIRQDIQNKCLIASAASMA